MAEDTGYNEQLSEAAEPAPKHGAHSAAAQAPAETTPVPDYIAAALAEMEEPVAPTPEVPEDAEAAPELGAYSSALLDASAQAATAYDAQATLETYGTSDPFAPSVPLPTSPVTSDPFLATATPSTTAPVATEPGSTAPQPPVRTAPRLSTNEAPALQTQDVFAVPDAPATPQPEALGQTGAFEPILTHTATSIETGAPRPIDVDPASTGAFSTISAGEGAVITNRDTASAAKDAALSNMSGAEAPKRSGRTREATNAAILSSRESRGVQQQQGKAPIVIAAVAVVAAIAVAAVLFLRSNANRPAEGAGGDQPQPAAEQVIVDPQGVVEFGGYQYALQQDQNGAWTVQRSSAGGANPAPIINLAGTPVALVLCDGALYIPENLESSWDVIAYMLADGSEPTQLTTADGALLGGQGALSEATMNGTTLTLVDTTGQAYAASLD